MDESGVEFGSLLLLLLLLQTMMIDDELIMVEVMSEEVSDFSMKMLSHTSCRKSVALVLRDDASHDFIKTKPIFLCMD
jgi:polysaccharide pyruvyl transferase WcaK-like protein